MKMEIEFTPLIEGLVPSAYRLSAQAGWNQVEEDWLRLMRLNPHGVQVWCDQGEVRASFSVVSYGNDIAWIGMILVDTAYRGSGLGKVAFEKALEFARTTNCKIIGLDATDMGEPIYRKYGFVSIGPIIRWGGVLESSSGNEIHGEIAKEITLEIQALDQEYSRVDRKKLLCDLVDAGGNLVIVKRNGSPISYGIIREGRNSFHLGPVVAENPDGFRAVMTIAGNILAGRKVICDSMESMSLSDMGLNALRHLKRMTLPISPGSLYRPGIYCGAGFELG